MLINHCSRMLMGVLISVRDVYCSAVLYTLTIVIMYNSVSHGLHTISHTHRCQGLCIQYKDSTVSLTMKYKSVLPTLPMTVEVVSSVSPHPCIPVSCPGTVGTTTVIITMVTGLPSVPRNVMVTSSGPRMITVVWDTPDFIGGDIIDYTVYFRTNQSNLTNTIRNVDAWRATISTDKLPDTTYFVSVSALGLLGDGEESEPVTITTDQLGSK